MYKRLYVSKEAVYLAILGAMLLICGILWTIMFDEIAGAAEVMSNIILIQLFSTDISLTGLTCRAITATVVFLFYLLSIVFIAYAISLKKTDDRINTSSHLKSNRF